MRTTTARRRGTGGFSLVELLIATALMLVLMLTVSFAFNNTSQTMRKATALVETHRTQKMLFDHLEPRVGTAFNFVSNPRSTDSRFADDLGGRGAESSQIATSICPAVVCPNPDCHKVLDAGETTARACSDCGRTWLLGENLPICGQVADAAEIAALTCADCGATWSSAPKPGPPPSPEPDPDQEYFSWGINIAIPPVGSTVDDPLNAATTHAQQTWSNFKGEPDSLTCMHGIPDAAGYADRCDDLHGKTTTGTLDNGYTETVVKDGFDLGTQEIRSRNAEFSETTYWFSGSAVWVRTNSRLLDAIAGNALEPAPKGGIDILVGPTWLSDKNERNGGGSLPLRRLMELESKDERLCENIQALKFEYQPYGKDFWLPDWITYGDLNGNNQYDESLPEPRYCARHRPCTDALTDSYRLRGYQDEVLRGPGAGTGGQSQDGGWWGVPGAVRVTVDVQDGRGILTRRFTRVIRVITGGTFPVWVIGTDYGGST